MTVMSLDEWISVSSLHVRICADVAGLARGLLVVLSISPGTMSAYMWLTGWPAAEPEPEAWLAEPDCMWLSIQAEPEAEAVRVRNSVYI